MPHSVSRLPAILAGVTLALAAAWTVAAQASQQPSATINQVIPITASVPVTLDNGSVQTVTVPLTVTLDIAVSVDGAGNISAGIGAAAEQPAEPETAAPLADEVTLDNAGDFLPSLADMPEGYRQRGEGEGSSNEKLAEIWPDPAAALERLTELGRVGSRYRTLQAPGFPIVGNGSIDASIVLFDSPEGAAGALDFYHERAQANVDSGEYDSLSPVGVTSLGDKADAYTLYKAPSEEGALDGYDQTTIAFVKGNVMVTMEARSFPGVGDAKQLIDLARQIAARLP